MAQQQRNDVERRVVGGEVRAATRDDGPAMLEGYAAVFGQETVIAGLFREQIRAGAFADAITDDVRGLYNHDPSIVLARTLNGTLRLREDKTGLRYEMDLNPADPDAQRVAAKVARGDVDQSSFAFEVSPDGEEWDYSETKDGKLPLRTITHIDALYDVSAVAYGAYPQTSVSARAEQRAQDHPRPADSADTAAVEAEAAAAYTRADVRRRRQQVVEAE